MIKWVSRRAIDKVKRDWNYDARYMRDMIDTSPRAAWLVSRVTDHRERPVAVGTTIARRCGA